MRLFLVGILLNLITAWLWLSALEVASQENLDWLQSHRLGWRIWAVLLYFCQAMMIYERAIVERCILANIIGAVIVSLKGVAWLYCLHFTEIEPEFCWTVVRLITLETCICSLLLLSKFTVEQQVFILLNVINVVTWAAGIVYGTATIWAICNAIMQITIVAILTHCRMQRVVGSIEPALVAMLGVTLVAINISSMFFTKHPVCELLVLETVVVGWFIYNYVYPNTAGDKIKPSFF